MTWRAAHTVAVIVGACLWVALWYAIGAILWFILTLK
jgi:hypothetical protein